MRCPAVREILSGASKALLPSFDPGRVFGRIARTPSDESDDRIPLQILHSGIPLAPVRFGQTTRERPYGA